MTLTTQIVKEYSCDFCPKAPDANKDYIGAISRVNVDGLSLNKWFEVYKNKYARHPLYACKACGHHLHEMLSTLCIIHEFDCNMYSYENNMGVIRILSD